MLGAQYLIYTVILLALVFDFINGFHDTANEIATLVSTGVAKTIGVDSFFMLCVISV